MNSAMLSMTPPAFVCFCRIWGARADMENVNPCRKECREHFLPSWPYIENTTRSMHNWRRTCVLYLIEKVPPIDGADELLTVCDVQHLFYISLNALGSCCLGRHQLTCKNNNRSNKNVLLCEGPCRLFKNCEEWALHDRPRYWSAVENSQSRPWLEPSETESSTFLDFYNLAWSRDPIGYSSGLPVGKDQLVGLWSDQKMFPQTTSVNPGTWNCTTHSIGGASEHNYTKRRDSRQLPSEIIDRLYRTFLDLTWIACSWRSSPESHTRLGDRRLLSPAKNK